MSHRSDASRGEAEQSITHNGETTDQPLLASNLAAIDVGTAYGAHRDDAIWITECAWCKRVRSPAGDWHTLTRAIRGAIGVELTHGICPECARAAVARADQIVDASP